MSKYTTTQTYHSHKCSTSRKNPCQTWISMGETGWSLMVFVSSSSPVLPQRDGWPLLECAPELCHKLFWREHRNNPYLGLFTCYWSICFFSAPPDHKDVTFSERQPVQLEKKNPGNQLCIFKYSIKIQYICGTSM